MSAPVFRYVVLDRKDWTDHALETTLNEYGSQGYRLLTPGLGDLFIMEWFDRDT